MLKASLSILRMKKMLFEPRCLAPKFQFHASFIKSVYLNQMYSHDNCQTPVCKKKQKPCLMLHSYSQQYDVLVFDEHLYKYIPTGANAVERVLNTKSLIHSTLNSLTVNYTVVNLLIFTKPWQHFLLKPKQR